MSEIRTKIPVDASKHYAKPWQNSQEELVSRGFLKERESTVCSTQ